MNDYCIGKYNGRMPADPAALYQMADGLSYIHGRGLVHRDISTGNVLFALNGDEVVMKIADFGFCKPASENGSFSMSEGAKGTKRFLAPELLRIMGSSHEKPRGKITSDIFSLGCLFFVFLTKGIHPFSDGSIHTISLNILSNNQFLGSNISLKPLNIFANIVAKYFLCINRLGGETQLRLTFDSRHD